MDVFRPVDMELAMKKSICVKLHVREHLQKLSLFREVTVVHHSADLDSRNKEDVACTCSSPSFLAGCDSPELASTVNSIYTDERLTVLIAFIRFINVQPHMPGCRGAYAGRPGIHHALRHGVQDL